MTTMPTRIEVDLYDAAKHVGTVMSRSAAQQINHWARIGRELETSAGVSHRDIAQVLAGRGSYDTLNGREQALVRAEWDERAAETREGLNFATEFEAAGVTGWVEADTHGNTVIHDSVGTVNPAPEAKVDQPAARTRKTPAVKKAGTRAAASRTKATPAVRGAKSGAAKGTAAKRSTR